MSFPIDMSKFQKLAIDPFSQDRLTSEQKAALANNIQLCRDAIVYFTACGSASGYGGHTGGAFDTVPEVMLMEAFFNARPDKFVPTFFDEAGHRVATQYLLSALHGHLPWEQLADYRKGHSQLPGHPELGYTPGVKFSSGRLGHMWAYVNGVAMANDDKTVFCLGSDGSQQEGNDAEAARLAVAQGLNVKLIIDDNDVTIAGHPSNYMRGYTVEKTLLGHGLTVLTCNGEDIDELYSAVRAAVINSGPVAVIAKRKMTPGIQGLEGETHGHDAIPTKHAIPYLESRGLHKAVAMLKAKTGTKDPHGKYLGSGAKKANRKEFGVAISNELDAMSLKERKEKVMVIDCDLEGSTGLKTIHQRHPEIYTLGGIMERGNISAAAGFGMEAGKQGIFSTFAAFLEMCISEITMSRLNNSNLLCHFSHSGSDYMADNTCHFGINNFFADNGLDEQQASKLYFPADAAQLHACIKTIFHQPGMRFVFTTRSSLPAILDERGQPVYGGDYKFQVGKDDVIREGKDGYIVSFGDALYRSLDAVERLKQKGLSVGLVNKSTLNVVDEATLAKVGSSKFVLVVEPFNTKTGLGSRFGTWLLERGYTPKYGHIGAHKEGCGGLWEQAYHQGYDSNSIIQKVLALQRTGTLRSRM
jgi:transketolase